MRLILAALIGAVVLFAWGFVSYVVLDYHWRVVHPMPQEDKVVPMLSSAIPRTGVYLIPVPMADPTAAPTEEEQKAWAAKHESGPIGMVFWRTQGAKPMEPKVFIRGLAINFIAAMCAAMVARFAAVAGAGLGRRWASIMLMAMFAGAAVNLTNWNYWYLPEDYTMVMVMDLLVGWALAGLPIAWMVGRRPTAAA